MYNNNIETTGMQDPVSNNFSKSTSIFLKTKTLTCPKNNLPMRTLYKTF